MRKHCRNTHRRSERRRRGRPLVSESSGDLERLWTHTDCQRIYRSGAQSHYIPLRPVEVALPIVTESSLWDSLAQRVSLVKQKQEQSITFEESRSTGQWIKRTGWDRYLASFDREELRTLIDFPSHEQSEWTVMHAMSSLVRSSQQLLETDAITTIRMILVQTSPDHYRHQPLQPYLEAQDLDRNLRYWQLIILFFIRTRRPRLSVPLYRLTVTQTALLTQVDQVVSTMVGTEERIASVGITELEKLLLDFCISLLDFRFDSDEYESPLLCALAVQGVGSGQKGWKTPQQFPSVLSGIIKIARFLVFRHVYELTLDVAPERRKSRVDLVQDMVHRFMQRGTNGPIDWMLALRAYGMKIAYQTTSDARVIWSGELLMYAAIQFTLSQFKDAIQKLLHDTRELLDRKLLFRDERSVRLPDIPWCELRDDHANDIPGWNFLQDVRHALPVDGATWLMRMVRDTPALAARFRSRETESQLQLESARLYFKDLATFRLQLAILVHLSAQPARIPELLSIRYRNSSQGEPRGIFIDDGLVATVTRYYKGSHYKGDTRIIYRYLPRVVGSLVVYYMWLIVPWVELLEVGTSDHVHFSSFLWPAKKDTVAPLTLTQFRTMFPQIFQQYLGQEINVAAYRHIAISIARQFHVAYLEREEGLDENELYDPEVDEEHDNFWDLQATHSTRTANVIYGREVGQLPGEQQSRRLRFREVSEVWHRILGLAGSHKNDHKLVVNVKVPPTNPSINDTQFRETETLQALLRRRWHQLREADYVYQVRVLYGPQARLRLNQHDVLEHIHHGYSPVLSIMPTGGGKSLLFILPASYDFSQVTVVVVPFLALVHDAVKQSRSLRVPAYDWTSTQFVPAGCRLLFVTPETAVLDKFMSSVQQLWVTGRLDRIVLDECHLLLLEDGSFRPAFLQLWRLAQYGVPLVYLTATLPPSREDTLWTALRLQNVPHYTFRVPTRRAELKLSVKSCLDSDKTPEIEKVLVNARTRGKTIIYCRSVYIVKRVAEIVNGFIYHAKYDDKEEAFRRFLDQPDGIIVATNALGAGIHVPDIRTIIHHSTPDSLLEYVQECGRGGRDGSVTQCVLLDSNTTPINDPNTLPQADEWMSRYIHPSSPYRCRRQVLSAYLDGETDSSQCDQSKEEALCDICERRILRTQQRQLERVEYTKAQNRVEIRPKFTDVQHSLQLHQEQVGLATRSEAQNVQQLIDWLSSHYQICLLCIGRNKHNHSPQECPHPDRGSYSQAKVQIKTQIKYTKFAACFGCGYPQSLCRKWHRTDRGYTRQDDVECEFPTILYEAAAMFLFMCQSDRAKLLHKRLNLDPKTHNFTQILMSKLGQRVRWSGIECSALFQEVFYWYLGR